MTTPEPRIPPLTDADVPEGPRKILLIDYVFVTCQFILVAVTLKTMPVPLEPDIEPLPRR